MVMVFELHGRTSHCQPKWKIVPTKDVIESAFKDPAKREEYQVTLPFLVLHGEEDTVTDPEVSRALYERARSSDKMMKLYPGMWHALTSGEPEQSVNIVFSDITEWLDKRTTGWKSMAMQQGQRSSNIIEEHRPAQL